MASSFPDLLAAQPPTSLTARPKHLPPHPRVYSESGCNVGGYPQHFLSPSEPQGPHLLRLQPAPQLEWFPSPTGPPRGGGPLMPAGCGTGSRRRCEHREVGQLVGPHTHSISCGVTPGLLCHWLSCLFCGNPDSGGHLLSWPWPCTLSPGGRVCTPSHLTQPGPQPDPSPAGSPRGSLSYTFKGLCQSCCACWAGGFQPGGLTPL